MPAKNTPENRPDLKAGETDVFGNTVSRILHREARYFIYETESKEVLVDSPEYQEKCSLAGITAAMMDIADLTIHSPALKARYNSRIALAYRMALDGDGDTCEKSLRSISQDMDSFLRRTARRAYQWGALIAAIIPVVALLIAKAFTVPGDLTNRVLLAAAFGGMGGFLSVLLGSRQLDVDVKETFMTNVMYGLFRIVVAVISATMIVFLIRADLVLGPLARAETTDGLVIACFLAGFSERLVPNVLKNFEHRTKNAR